MEDIMSSESPRKTPSRHCKRPVNYALLLDDSDSAMFFSGYTTERPPPSQLTVIPPEVILHHVLPYLGPNVLIRLSEVNVEFYRLSCVEMERRLRPKYKRKTEVEMLLQPVPVSPETALAQKKEIRKRRRISSNAMLYSSLPMVLPSELNAYRENFRKKYEKTCRRCWVSPVETQTARSVLHGNLLCYTCLREPDFNVLPPVKAKEFYGLEGLLLLGLMFVEREGRKYYIAKEVLERCREVYGEACLVAADEQGWRQRRIGGGAMMLSKTTTLEVKQMRAMTWMLPEYEWQRKTRAEFESAWKALEPPCWVADTVAPVLDKVPPEDRDAKKNAAELWSEMKMAYLALFDVEGNKIFYVSQGAMGKRANEAVKRDHHVSVQDMMSNALKHLETDFALPRHNEYITREAGHVRDSLLQRDGWSNELVTRLWREKKVFRRVILNEYAAGRFGGRNTWGWHSWRIRRIHEKFVNAFVRAKEEM